MVNSETAESVSQGELWVKGEWHGALEIKGLGSQESLLQRCETKVGTQQRFADDKVEISGREENRRIV